MTISNSRKEELCRISKYCADHAGTYFSGQSIPVVRWIESYSARCVTAPSFLKRRCGLRWDQVPTFLKVHPGNTNAKSAIIPLKCRYLEARLKTRAGNVRFAEAGNWIY